MPGEERQPCAGPEPPIFPGCPEKPAKQRRVLGQLEHMPFDPFSRAGDLDLGEEGQDTGPGEENPSWPREEAEQRQQCSQVPRMRISNFSRSHWRWQTAWITRPTT